MKCLAKNCTRCWLNRQAGANFHGHKYCNLSRPATLGSPEEYADAVSAAAVRPINDAASQAAARATPDGPPPAPVQTPPQPAGGGSSDFWWKYRLLKGYLVDGPARGEQATILFFVEAGFWKACLHDRCRSRSAWSTGEDWTACLDALEGRLADGTVEWRRSWKSST